MPVVLDLPNSDICVPPAFQEAVCARSCLLSWCQWTHPTASAPIRAVLCWSDLWLKCAALSSASKYYSVLFPARFLFIWLLKEGLIGRLSWGGFSLERVFQIGCTNVELKWGWALNSSASGLWAEALQWRWRTSSRKKIPFLPELWVGY